MKLLKSMLIANSVAMSPPQSILQVKELPLDWTTTTTTPLTSSAGSECAILYTHSNPVRRFGLIIFKKDKLDYQDKPVSLYNFNQLKVLS